MRAAMWFRDNYWLRQIKWHLKNAYEICILAQYSEKQTFVLSTILLSKQRGDICLCSTCLGCQRATANGCTPWRKDPVSRLYPKAKNVGIRGIHLLNHRARSPLGLLHGRTETKEAITAAPYSHQDSKIWNLSISASVAQGGASEISGPWAILLNFRRSSGLHSLSPCKVVNSPLKGECK